MIELERMGLMERIKRAVSPAYRARQAEETKAAIRWLVAHPDAPCVVCGNLVENGYGQHNLKGTAE